MKCRKCGNEIEEKDEYCGNCGAKVKTNKTIKLKFNYLVAIIAVIVISIIIGIIVLIYNENVKISNKYLTDNFKQNGFSQYDDVNVEVLDVENINYQNFNKIVFAKITITENGTSLSNAGLLLVNKKENKVEGITVNTNLFYILNGVAKNDTDKTEEVTKLSAKYVQMLGADIFQEIGTADFENLINEYSKIIGLKKCREYIKAENKKINTNLDATLLFEKDSPMIKYIAFYETTLKYNANYPIDERTFKYFSNDYYSHKNTINTLEYLYGPAYTTVNEYAVYKLEGNDSVEDLEKSKVGSYSTLEEAKETLNVEE